MADPFDLRRFVNAQAGVHARALEEIRRGRKQGHWMWFVFPQLAGLGSSPMAQRFAIGSPAEARAYLSHPELGPRLLACAEACAALHGRSAEEVFGPVDALKLRSSLTLFEAVAADAGRPFAKALDVLCGGARDPLTLRRLNAAGQGGAAA